MEGQRSAQRVSAWTWSRASERRIFPDSQDLVGNLPWGSSAPVVVSQAPDVLEQCLRWRIPRARVHPSSRLDA